VVVDDRVAGLQLDRALQVGDGLLALAEPVVGPAEAVVM
jgi:hypothetical protein